MLSNPIYVHTRFNIDIIEQSTVVGDSIHQTARQIIHLQEDGVREALIALRWTPPKEAK